MATMRTEYVNVPGGFVSLRILGENESAIPLLYVHGGPGGNFSSFTPMAERLSADRTVYMYNQLGSDDSGHTDEEDLWTPERYIASLGELIAALNVKKLHIVGRSWGAMLAAEHLLRTPDSPVVSITMTSPYLSTRLWIQDAKHRLAEMGGDYLKIVEKCESETHFDDMLYQQIIKEYNDRYQCRPYAIAARENSQLSRAVKAKTASGMKVYRHMWGPSEFTCTGVMKDIDITDRLSQIRVRVLFIIGEYDQVMPQTCKYYLSLIPGSVMAVIPDASQTAFLENPDVFYVNLTDFLNHF